jgi:hypothetical protein
MRALQRAWGKVTKPRHVKVIYLVIYIVSALIGLVTLIRPPQTISGIADLIGGA